MYYGDGMIDYYSPIQYVREDITPVSLPGYDAPVLGITRPLPHQWRIVEDPRELLIAQDPPRGFQWGDYMIQGNIETAVLLSGSGEPTYTIEEA